MTYEAVDKFGNVGSAFRVSINSAKERPPRRSPFDSPTICAADADLLAEIERLRERATTYGSRQPSPWPSLSSR